MGQKFVIVALVFSLFSLDANSQKLIKGFVIDSASFAPLMYVNIKIKNASRGTTASEKGEFIIHTAKNDTLVFSLVGYNPEEFSAAELEETIIIRMGVKVKELREVVIIGQKEKVVRSTHIAPRSNVTNYGPYGAGIDLGYFSKFAREKRKLIRVKSEHDRIKNYIAVVCSPEIRERICREYSLTDDQYFQLLAKFNIQNLNMEYDLTVEEWVTVLRSFYSENVIKR